MTTTRSMILNGFTLIILTLLPCLGLVSGPSYAALVFGLGAVWLITGVVLRQQTISIDRVFLLLATLYVGWGLALSPWAIDPHYSRSVALQMSGILAMALVVMGIASPEFSGQRSQLSLWMSIACLVGAVLIGLDTLFDFPLQRLFDARGMGSKYNRGIAYLILLVWPLLAVLWQPNKRRLFGLVCLSTVFSVGIGFNTTAKIVLVGAALVFWLARRWPALMSRGLMGLTILVGLGLPFFLRAVEGYRTTLYSVIKSSAFHRLEIWDYMSARIVDRPWTGWGLGDSKLVPIRPDELLTYHYADGFQIYPHNQWLQLWVENGVVGALIGVVFCLGVLVRIEALKPHYRPFALAAYVSAMIIAFTGFTIETDSWWAAIAVTALLFGQWGRDHEHPSSCNVDKSWLGIRLLSRKPSPVDHER